MPALGDVGVLLQVAENRGAGGFEGKDLLRRQGTGHLDQANRVAGVGLQCGRHVRFAIGRAEFLILQVDG